MRQHLLCAAAFVAAALPGAAHAAGGYVDLSYGRVDIDDGGDDGDVIAFGGAANFELGDRIEAQADAHWARADTDEAVTVDQAAFHIFSRGDRGSYGFVASVEDYSGSVGQAYALGLEGQLYIERVNFDFSASAVKFDTADEDATRLRGGMTLFPTDNFSVGGAASQVELNGGGELIVYSADAEYKPAEGRTSYFASYRSSENSDFFGAGAHSGVFALGFRLNIDDGASLFERSRTGAGMRTGGQLSGGVF